MKRLLRVLLKTTFLVIVVFLLYLGSLFFREERLSERVSEALIAHLLPTTNIVVHCKSIGFGLTSGVTIEDLKVYDRSRKEALKPMAAADLISINHLMRYVRIVGAKYPRLPDSYYAEGNLEKNGRVEAEFPELPPFQLELVEPDILSVTPTRVTCEVAVGKHRIDFNRAHLDWPDEGAGKEPLGVDGYCYIDLDRQQLYGQVEGKARQLHIRPMMITLDIPVAMPYFDGFTEVTNPVPSFCSWQVNLVNNDLDLHLDLHPTLGKYNSVPMQKADGHIHLHNFIRGTNLNYRQTIGPIVGVGPKQEALAGSVIVSGINGYNVVDIDAKSGLPLAHLLKIGGFTDDYVDDSVIGDSECKIQFRFPRAMTNNYEALNGNGHIAIKDGKLMQMKLFAGLTKIMSDHVPGVSWVTDQTQANCDYVISNGVVQVGNAYIEGGLFSIKMDGSFDATQNKLDFIARIQFMKKDTIAGKILHPLTWPFTKLLLEARLTGTPAKPEWKYISVVDRVLETVL